MARTPWKPTSDEQRAVVARLDEVAAGVKEMPDLIARAKELGVPKDVIAEHLSPAASRSKVYRHLRKTEAGKS